MSSYKRKKILTGIPIIVIAILLITIILFPILWLIINSFKDTLEVYKVPPTWIPKRPTFEVYKNVLSGIEQTTPWWRFILNSLVVGIGTAFLGTIMATLAGYGFARFNSPVFTVCLLIILLALMLPGPVIIVPLFTIVDAIGLEDKLIGLIFIHTALVLPLLTWMGVGNIRTVPIELEEAGLIDGCSRLRIIFLIVLPLARLGIITAMIFSFLISWGDFPFALILLDTRTKFTVPLGLTTYITEFNTWWNQLAVATLVSILPVIILISVAHQNIREGIIAGAMKG